MNSVKQFIRSYPWVIALVVGAVFIISAARMHEMWGDEAETALFARNILHYGVPRGWDGTNIMGIENGIVLDQNLLNHTSPWAQYYMVALSFALFGQSSFTARIPSIILFLLSIPLVYFVTKKITGDKLTAFFASLITALSVQGILFGYQARYYELVNVAGLLFVWAAVSLSPGRRWAGILFIIAGILFCYANYVEWIAWYTGTFVVSSVLVWLSKGHVSAGRHIRQFFLFTIPILLFTLPWFIIMRPLTHRGSTVVSSFTDIIGQFPGFVSDAWSSYIRNGILPIGMIILFVVVMIWRWRDKKIRLSLILFSGVPTILLIMMALFSSVITADTSFAIPRYSTAAIPFFCIVAAIIITAFFRCKRWIGIILLIVYLGTNLMMFSQPRSYMYDLLGEIVHPYKTPDVIVAKYLKDHTHPGDTVFVNLDRDHEPLIFYLGSRLKFVNRVSLVNTGIFPKNRSIIPRYIYDFRGEPDWLVMYSKRGDDDTWLTMDFRSLWIEVNLPNDYTEHVIPIFFSDLTRPEMDVHSFTGIIKPDPTDYVYIYEKK